MLVILRITVISLCVCPVFCVAPHDQFYVKLRVPDGYFLEMQENPHKEFGTRPDCAFGCAAEAGCEAFVVRGGKCALGTMNMTNPNVPSFVPDGMDIMVKKDKVALNALSIPHIGSLTLDLNVPYDTAVVNATDFPPVQMSRYPGKEAGGSIFGVTNYKNGLVACGGTSGGAIVKTCHRWSFHSGEWTEMRGELWHAHFDGGLVVLGDRLWMFMGAPTDSSDSHRKVESYEMGPGRWREESDAGTEHPLAAFGAAVFDETKVHH